VSELDRETTKFRAVIYPESKQIACVLLQAVYGADPYVPSRYFDSKIWAVSPPTEKGLMVSGTDDEWRELARRWTFKR
jgi:hypothetical protein